MRDLYSRLIASHRTNGSTFIPPVPMLPAVKSAPWRLGEKTFVMGILNVTPDSFSDGADLQTVEDAIARALDMESRGVDLLDIGGESSRPGAEAVGLEEELRRVIPVIKGIRAQSSIPISIDTTKSEVARQAIAAGANIVNDISAGVKDPDMFAAVAKLRVPVRQMLAVLGQSCGFGIQIVYLYRWSVLFCADCPHAHARNAKDDDIA